MSKPVSPKPLRKVAAICAYSQDDPPLRNPIIGIAVCCARAASGYATHRRTAQQCDELASFQMIKLHLTAPARDFAAAYRIGQDRVRGLPRCEISARLTAAGSKSVIRRCRLDVRFARKRTRLRDL
jgi:hypothetical protein